MAEEQCTASTTETASVSSHLSASISCGKQSVSAQCACLSSLHVGQQVARDLHLSLLLQSQFGHMTRQAAEHADGREESGVGIATGVAVRCGSGR